MRGEEEVVGEGEGEGGAVTKSSAVYHGDQGSTLSVSLVTEAFLGGAGY